MSEKGKKTITTKEKLDGSKEIMINKSPSKTTLGKIIITLIIIGTIVAPIAVIIYYLARALG